MSDALRKKAAGFGLPILLLFCVMVADAGEGVGPGFPVRGALAVAEPQAQPAVAATATTPSQQFESQPLHFPQSSRRPARGEEQSGGRSYSMPSIMPALFSVALVCGLFLGILYLAKKYLPGHRQLFTHPAMEVLGRTHLDQRRYVSLLRVGKRIVVVGVSPDEMRPLSEITDEEEITAILEVARPKSEMGLTIFQRLFKRHVIEAEADENQAVAVEKAQEIEDQMSSLRERVRAIREREEPSRHVDAIG